MVFQIDGILTRIQRELEQFEKIASHDAARQLRLAQAFMGLQRWREAGALPESAVTLLPPDKLFQNAAQTELASWQQIPRWDKVLDATTRYPDRFQPAPDAPEIPQLRLARAEALHGLNRTAEAERAYGDIAEAFPDHKLAPRAFFMGGICQMELDPPEAAVVTFQKQWAPARDLLATYLKKYPGGLKATDAMFDRARCLHNQFQHDPAAKELADFLKDHPDHPDHPRRAEATLLLGESLMTSGKMKDDMNALKEVPESEDRLFEEAQFKIGEGLRKLERPADERDHFAAFTASLPRSRRLAEAVLYQGRGAAKACDPDAARILYWTILEKLGSDAANQGVEDLLLATRRLYPGGEGIVRLMEKLDRLHRSARAASQKTMAVRALWARGHLLRESSPDQVRTAFMQLGDLLDPALHHPRILADCADARCEAGAPRTARDLYEALRKWNPRAIEKERSSYGLGLISLTEGKKEEALLWFQRCRQEAVGGTAGPDAGIEEAILLRDSGKSADAYDLLEKVTTNRLAQHRQKARALLELGRTALARQDPTAAAKHFERCYLSGAKFKEYAAPAWLAHGCLLESQNKLPEAAAVYQSFLTKKITPPSRRPPAPANAWDF